MSINESPVLVVLNPRVDATRKDLPVTLYETGLCGWAHTAWELERRASGSLFCCLAMHKHPADTHLRAYQWPCLCFCLLPPCIVHSTCPSCLLSRLSLTAELRVADGVPQQTFVKSTYTVEVGKMF